MTRTAIIFAVICSFTLTLTSQSIIFEKEDWQKVLDKAAQSQKGIFIDFYTSWCGPCKKLDQITFRDESVASYFNDLFVNYKVDAEKGEGKLLATSFGVGAYPTMLFLDAKGVLLLTSRGFKKPESLIKIAELATSLETDHHLGDLMGETVNLNKAELHYLLEHSKEFHHNNKSFYLTRYYGLLTQEEKEDREIQRRFLGQYKNIKDEDVKDELINSYKIPSVFERIEEKDVRLHFNLTEDLNAETIQAKRSGDYGSFKQKLNRKVRFLLTTNRIKPADTMMIYMENDLLFYGQQKDEKAYQDLAIPFMEKHLLPKILTRKNMAITRDQADQVMFLSICKNLSSHYGRDQVKQQKIIGWLDQVIDMSNLIEAYIQKAKIYEKIEDKVRKDRTIYEALSKPLNPKQKDILNKMLG